MEAISITRQRYVRANRYDRDLSESTLIQVLEAYQEHQRKTKPKFTLNPLIEIIKQFQVFIGGDLYPDEVTDLFYDDFIKYMFDARKLKASTMAKYCGTLVCGLKFGSKHNVKLSSTYDEFEIKPNAPVKITLKADEISFIYHFDLSTLHFRPDKIRKLEKVRDAFVLQCNLYQRFSDISELEKNSNIDNGVYRRRTQKTDSIATVDINHETISPEVTFDILNKYEYKFPYEGNINNYNLGLHALFSSIGGSMNDIIVTEERIGRDVVKVEHLKWQLLTSHSARHTAATLATMRGMNEVMIRKCLGHSAGSYTVFRYQDYNAIR